MTPYHIDAKFNGMWIDLDHVLAIGDFTSRDTDATGHFPRASFSVVLAFQDKPLQFAVHDRSEIDGFCADRYTIRYIYTPASTSDVSELKYTYDKLLKAWKNNRG